MVASTDKVDSALRTINDAFANIPDRVAAATQLGESEDPRAVESLYLAAMVNEPTLRSTAVAALAKLGVVDDEIKRLQSTELSQRRLAAERLAVLSDARCIDAMLIALNDTDAGIRSNAARTLCVLDDERIDFALINALSDPHADVRVYAVAGLGRKKNPAFLPMLKAAYAAELDDVVLDFLQSACRQLENL